ncbi:MAG TPA: DUF86 domain-containing protein [Bacteroidales bacterium]|nr:DUF86 domain-containing protein [Bacteroidales bacterium]HRZ20594.1 DUF86 domain-containing protein [Bacteroidales bacterium]
MKKYLYDIKVSIDSINDYLGDQRIFTDYQKNKLVRRAVERELEIIGEALNSLLKLYPETNIQDARKIVDLRNWVIHGYDKVDDVIVWGILTRNLPILKNNIEKLLGE